MSWHMKTSMKTLTKSQLISTLYTKRVGVFCVLTVVVIKLPANEKRNNLTTKHLKYVSQLTYKANPHNLQPSRLFELHFESVDKYFTEAIV